MFGVARTKRKQQQQQKQQLSEDDKILMQQRSKYWGGLKRNGLEMSLGKTHLSYNV